MAILNPPQAGEFRVFNQFTEIFNVLQLAEMVQREGSKLGFDVKIQHLPNPRVEAEQHYYNPTHRKLIDLGLTPHLLSDVLLDSMLVEIRDYAPRVKKGIILPRVRWDGRREEAEERKLAWAAPRASGD